MPNRILKETICSSDNLDQLDADTERFFYRLMVQCDDFGRMDARPSILRARCFPLKLNYVNEDDITRMLADLVAASLIFLYQADDGKPYLQMITWEKHQQIRAKRSKYPQPKPLVSKPADLISDDIKCNQLQANVPENPIQSNTNTTTNSSSSDIPFAQVISAYEQNFGPITQMISEQVGDDFDRYGGQLCLDAMAESLKHNIRKWSYVQGILSNWFVEGRKPTRQPPPNGHNKNYREIWVDGELRFEEIPA